MKRHMKRHPHFGHTLADHFMEHHKHPLSFHGPVVHVKAIIKLVEDDDNDPKGGTHQHFLVHQIEVIDIVGGDKASVADEAFCAIRYGDNLGLKEKISGLKEGEEIELKGEYIDKNHALPGVGNPDEFSYPFYASSSRIC